MTSFTQQNVDSLEKRKVLVKNIIPTFSQQFISGKMINYIASQMKIIFHQNVLRNSFLEMSDKDLSLKRIDTLKIQTSQPSKEIFQIQKLYIQITQICPLKTCLVAKFRIPRTHRTQDMLKKTTLKESTAKYNFMWAQKKLMSKQGDEMFDLMNNLLTQTN